MNKIEIKTLQDFFDAVHRFNSLSGNLDDVETAEELATRFKNQAERVIEEAKEVIEGCEQWDEEMVLDGVVDVMVTAFGLLQQAAPYMNTIKAAELICQNNLEKFLYNPSEELVMENIAYYLDKEEEVKAQFLSLGNDVIVTLRRVGDNKIMKPKGFVPVSLKEIL